MTETVTIATTGQKMSAKEFAERRYATKAILQIINYARSRLSGYPTSFQIDQYPLHRPTVWKVIMTVQYAPQEPPLEIIPTMDQNGRL